MVLTGLTAVVHTAISGVSDTCIGTAVPTIQKWKQNDWKNARLRLITLRIILQLDMWNDIKYGTVSAKNADALCIGILGSYFDA